MSYPKCFFTFTVHVPCKFHECLFFSASLSCIPYGLMLGWPCPTYPILLEKNVEPGIIITWDQTAMTAGFLMLGNTFGTPFSDTMVMSSKFGMLLGINKQI